MKSSSTPSYPPLPQHFGRSARDLISKKFASGLSSEVTAKTISASRQLPGEYQLTYGLVNVDNALVGKLNSTYDGPNYTFSTTGYTSAVPGDRTQLTIKQPFKCEGLSFTAGVAAFEKSLGFNNTVFNTGVEYKTKQVTCFNELYSDSSVHKLSSQVSFGMSGSLSVGVSALLSMVCGKTASLPQPTATTPFLRSQDGRFQLDNVSLSSEYNINKQTQAAMSLDQNGRRATLTMSYLHSPEHSFAIQAETPTCCQSASASTSTRQLSVAHQFLISPNNFIKVKASAPSGLISIATESKLVSPRLSFGLTATVDMKKSLNQVSNWGAALNFNY